MEQITMTERREQERPVQLALHKLWQHTACPPPPLGTYYPEWPTVKHVPVEKLNGIARALEDDVKSREVMGDARYFAQMDVASKVEAFIYAAQALLYEAEKAGGDGVGRVITWRDFNRQLWACVGKYHDTNEHAYLLGRGLVPPFVPWAYKAELAREAEGYNYKGENANEN
ncbi:MAG: hypothetical protein ACK5L3_08680 [Oscillospiraceae bacterium]